MTSTGDIHPAPLNPEAASDTIKADQTLEDLGYVPELSRNRSVWQVTFMCFILSSVP